MPIQPSTWIIAFDFSIGNLSHLLWYPWPRKVRWMKWIQLQLAARQVDLLFGQMQAKWSIRKRFRWPFSANSPTKRQDTFQQIRTTELQNIIAGRDNDWGVIWSLGLYRRVTSLASSGEEKERPADVVLTQISDHAPSRPGFDLGIFWTFYYNLEAAYCGVWPIKCRQGSKTNKSTCQFWKKLIFD
jgi:hypothetical protein